MIINVTQKHIDEGQALTQDNMARCHCCPIARAVQDATHYELVTVTPGFIKVYNSNVKIVSRILNLPEEVRKFICDADMYRKPEEYKDKLKPFSFEI